MREPSGHRWSASPSGTPLLDGNLWVPRAARGVVLFAHGSGSSRLQPAQPRRSPTSLHDAGLGTLLFDLLTDRGGRDLRRTASTSRCSPSACVAATGWVARRSRRRAAASGYFGASTGAAAALVAAARPAATASARSSRAAVGPTSRARRSARRRRRCC